MAERYAGGCLCGAVRYRVEGRMRPIIACHCRECRRQSGHFYAATQAPRDEVNVSGDESLRWYRASGRAARGFCLHCGSALFFQRDGGDGLTILAGSLDEPHDLALIGHIYVAEKGAYYTLDDGLPERARGCDGDPVRDLTGGQD
jgi:hypothetical protein